MPEPLIYGPGNPRHTDLGLSIYPCAFSAAIQVLTEAVSAVVIVEMSFPNLSPVGGA